MKVTLLQLCKAKGFSEFQILKLKKELIDHKKSGKIFFHINLLNLDLNTPFDLYYCLLPNQHSTVDAFPVPLHSFRFVKEESERFYYLKEFFENYYITETMEKKLFHSYEQQKPFIGEEYVWYFKRTANFS